MTARIVLFLLVLAVSSCKPALESELDARLGSTVGASGPGLAVLVMKDSIVLLEHTRGVTDLEHKTPIGSNTNFRLASVTKQFTASAVLLLAADGALRLDQTLTEFFPDFPPYGRAITLRQCLTHTSGLADYENLMPDTTTVPVLDRDVLLLLESEDSTLFVPGTQFRYSNSGYALLALVVERVSGQRFADFLKSRIFAPLGMDGTVAYERGISTVQSRAYGHSPDVEKGGGLTETDQSLTSSVLGDGGVYSSLDDLRRWAAELYRPTVLDPALLREAMSAQVRTVAAGESYGYGWYVAEHNGERLVRHSGSTVGFRTELRLYPELHLTVIVLANRTDINPAEIAATLAERVLEGEDR